MKTLRTFVFALPVSVIGVAVLHAFLTCEPVADGRTLSSWLRLGDYDESSAELIAATKLNPSNS